MNNQYTKGDEFNNWTVLATAGRTKTHEQLYKCQCICGTVRNVRKSNLGKVMGCGCVRRTYKERTANPKPPQKIKTQNATTKQNVGRPLGRQKPTPKPTQPTSEQATKCRSVFRPSNKANAKPTAKTESEKISTTQLIARKLEDMQLAKELESHYSLN